MNPRIVDIDMLYRSGSEVLGMLCIIYVVTIVFVSRKVRCASPQTYWRHTALCVFAIAICCVSYDAVRTFGVGRHGGPDAIIRPARIATIASLATAISVALLSACMIHKVATRAARRQARRLLAVHGAFYGTIAYLYVWPFGLMSPVKNRDQSVASRDITIYYTVANRCFRHRLGEPNDALEFEAGDGVRLGVCVEQTNDGRYCVVTYDVDSRSAVHTAVECFEETNLFDTHAKYCDESFPGRDVMSSIGGRSVEVWPCYSGRFRSIIASRGTPASRVIMCLQTPWDGLPVYGAVNVYDECVIASIGDTWYGVFEVTTGVLQHYWRGDDLVIMSSQHKP